MVSNSDLEKWQKAIQGIEAKQAEMDLQERSAFQALKGLFNNGDFESGESGDNLKIIKDNLKQHDKHRLLQIHLKNFIALCEQNFTNKSAAFVQTQVSAPVFVPPPEIWDEPVPVHTVTNPLVTIGVMPPTPPEVPPPPIIQPPSFQPPVMQPPTFQPPVNQETKAPEPEKLKEETIVKPIIIEFAPPVSPASSIIAPDIQEEKDGNQKIKKSNKQLFFIIVAIALLVGGWQIYQHWDTVKNWEPVSKLWDKKPIPVEPAFIHPFVGIWKGTLNNEIAMLEFMTIDTVGNIKAQIYFLENRPDTLKLNGTIKGNSINLQNETGKYSGILQPDSSIYSGTFYDKNIGASFEFSFRNPKYYPVKTTEQIDSTHIIQPVVYTVTSVPNVHLKNAGDYVTNPDGIISQTAKEKLNAMINSVQNETTDEIAVVLLSSIGGDDVDDFGTHLFNYWGIGKKNVNNGLLFLLVNDQKQMIFRTGSGLEKALPDIILSQVIHNDISPSISSGDFDGGIIAGIAKVCDYLKKPETVQKIMQSNNELQPDSQTTKVIEKTYPFGIYKGGAINGYPEGNGKMTYSRQVQIAKQDTKSPPHFANPGDYFIGSWGNGDIVSGTLYDKNSNAKEKILAPKRFSLYDISKD